jgi:hypothetical protein
MSKNGGRLTPKAAQQPSPPEIEEAQPPRTPAESPAEGETPPDLASSAAPEEEADATTAEDDEVLRLVSDPNGPFATPVEDEVESPPIDRHLHEVLQPMWRSKGLKLCPICGWVVTASNGRCSGSPKEHGQFRPYAPKKGTIYNPAAPSDEDFAES